MSWKDISVPPKILVVDDEPDLEVLIRQRFRKQIRDDELRFEFAQNGVQALQKLDEHRDISVILSDINMPEMDGLTLLEKVGETEQPGASSRSSSPRTATWRTSGPP